jgi:hypothetical protein
MHYIRLLAAMAMVAGAVAAQPSGTGVLAGKVVQRGNREPVRKAAVSLIWHGSPQSVALARTDPDGSFAFEGLPAGRYTLSANKDGVGAGSYGDTGNGTSPEFMSPEFVTLAEGERRGGLVIRMSLPASISGVVLDADGEPAQGAQVQAMMAAYPRGTRQLVSISAGNTNLKGEYHLRGLQPGKYYVLLQNAAPPADGTEGVAFQRQYYGGASDWRRAAPIAVSSGEQIRGIDFRATMTRSVRLAGRVTGMAAGASAESAPGVSAQFVNIQLQRVGDDAQSNDYGIGAGPPDFNFLINAVTPGRYKVTASLRERDGRMLYSRQFIEVSEQPAEIEVALAPAVDLKGTMRYEGDPALRPNEFQVQLVSGESIPVEPPPPAKVNADGTFTLIGVPPGIWDISPGPIPKGGFMKSMHLGKQDVLTEEMEIAPATEAPLTIVISSRGGRVEGELEDEAARRKPALIMLAPTGKFAAVMSFFGITNSDPERRFKLSGLTPGPYILFAFQQPPKGDFRGPDLVEKMSRLGVPVEVREGETSNVAARLITPEQLKEILP